MSEKEIDTLPAYCYNCWEYLGDITGTSEALARVFPLCYSCGIKKIGNVKPPEGWKPHE